MGSHNYLLTFGVRKLFTFTVSKRTRMFVLQVKSKVFFVQFKKFDNSLYDDLFKRFLRYIHKQTVTKLESRKLNICPKGAKMGSIIGHRIDYKGGRGSERPAGHTQQKLTQVPPLPSGVEQGILYRLILFLYSHVVAYPHTVKPVLSGQQPKSQNLFSLFTLNETFIKRTPLLSGRGHLKST